MSKDASYKFVCASCHVVILQENREAHDNWHDYLDRLEKRIG